MCMSTIYPRVREITAAISQQISYEDGESEPPCESSSWSVVHEVQPRSAHERPAKATGTCLLEKDCRLKTFAKQAKSGLDRFTVRLCPAKLGAMGRVFPQFSSKELSLSKYVNIDLWLGGTNAVSIMPTIILLSNIQGGLSNTSDHLLVRNACNVQDHNDLVHVEPEPGAVGGFECSDIKDAP
jgi:hypothetical protein